MSLYWTVTSEEYTDEDGQPAEALVFSITDEASGRIFITQTEFEEIFDHAEDEELTGEIAKVLATAPTMFQLPLLTEELRLLDWLSTRMSTDDALDVLAAWRWSAPWNDVMSEFLIDHQQLRVLKMVDGLPAMGRLQLPGGQVQAVAINAIPSEDTHYGLLRVVVLEEAEDEDAYGEELILLPFSVLHVDERSFLPEASH